MQTTEQILPTMRRAVPQIYMYDDTSFPGWIKIGQTTRADVRKRIDEQHPITEPHKTYHLLWRDDLLRHRDFEGWQYYSSREADATNSLTHSHNNAFPLVVFGSFLDYLGRDRYGNIKPKNEWVHSIDWDLIVLDEYHFGAWNDNAKRLLDLGDADAKRRQAEEDEVMSESGIDVESGRAWDDADIPIFMYLTDYREESLEDVIRKLEPKLFERVTGLTIDDFDLLLRVGVFNRAQMNDAILKFRRYEDASLAYTGVNRHEADTRIGLMDSTIPIEAIL